MLGQRHQGVGAEQAGVPGVIQGGGKLQAQVGRALVIHGIELRADQQQVAACLRRGRRAADRAAQVGQVMGGRAPFGPDQEGDQAAAGDQCDQEYREFTDHGYRVGR
ncbi:hypothetical protein D3C86_1558660 [compost metagenome]